MKKYQVRNIVVVAVFTFFFTMGFHHGVWALGDNNNSNANANSNSNHNVVDVDSNSSSKASSESNSFSASGAIAGVNHSGNSSSNSSVNNSGNSSVKDSGNSNVRTSTNQEQGQLQGQQQQSNPSNTTSTEVNTGNGNKAYAYGWAGVSAEEGTSNGGAGSVFGSINISDTDNYKKAQVIIQTIVAAKTAGVISQDQANAYCDTLIKKMMLAVKTKRILGIGPETSGKNLFNLLGLLSVDSFWKDGQAQGGQLLPSQQAAATEALNKAEVTNADVTTGNGGNFKQGEYK